MVNRNEGEPVPKELPERQEALQEIHATIREFLNTAELAEEILARFQYIGQEILEGRRPIRQRNLQTREKRIKFLFRTNF